MSRSASPFIDSILRFMSVRRYSPRTIEAYLYWIKYYIHYHRRRHPEEMGGAEVEQFLTFLSVERRVSVSTQRLALNAIAFLYNRFLDRPLGDLRGFMRARVPAKLPVVLTRIEVSRVLAQLEGVPLMMASLLYGSGLRRLEVARLRVAAADTRGNSRVKEADLPKHLRGGEDEDAAEKTDAKEDGSEKKGEDPLASRDYTLFEALNLLKGLNILRKAES